MKAPNDQQTPSTTVPVVEEQLQVGKILRETGAVRVRIETEQHETPVALERAADEVVVERVAVDRVVSQRQAPWQDGDVTVVPVYAEVPFVEHRLVLVEEVRLQRRSVRLTETQQVPVQRQRVVVERRQPDGSWLAADPDTDHGR